MNCAQKRSRHRKAPSVASWTNHPQQASLLPVRPLIPSLILAVILPLTACGKSSQQQDTDSSVNDAGIGGQSSGGSESEGGGGGGNPNNSGGGPAAGGAPLTPAGGGESGGAGAMGGEGPQLSGGTGGLEGSGGGSGGGVNGCGSSARGCQLEDDVVCDELGQLQRCDECLQHQPTGQECLRLLTIDRESGMMCAVRGADALVCVAGEYDWTEPRWGTFPLPEAPVDFSLGENTPTGDELPASCWINLAGELKCHLDPDEVLAVDCAQVEVGSLPDKAAFCGGTWVSDLPLPDPGSVDSFTLSDVVVVWLDDAGHLHSSFPDDTLPAGSFVDVVLSDLNALCAIRSDGTLVCVDDERTGPFEATGDFVQVGGSGDNVKCALAANGTISCFAMDETGFSAAYSPPGDTFVSVVSGRNESCALTQAGTAVCWNEEGLVHHDAPLFD